MTDNSLLEITLDANNNVWWMIIDAAAFVALVLIACEQSAGVSSLACMHVELNEQKAWNFEPSFGSISKVSCVFWHKLWPIINRFHYMAIIIIYGIYACMCDNGQ